MNWKIAQWSDGQEEIQWRNISLCCYLLSLTWVIMTLQQWNTTLNGTLVREEYSLSGWWERATNILPYCNLLWNVAQSLNLCFISR